MIKFEVKNRFTGDVQFTAEIDCKKNEMTAVKMGLAVKHGASLNGARLDGANLDGARLDGANLDGANLYRASLNGIIGNMRQIKSVQVETYPICYTAARLQIGCENHSLDEWRSFDDAAILDMDGKKALKFWRKWKGWIFQTIEMSPAEPTGYEEKTND